MRTIIATLVLVAATTAQPAWAESKETSIQADVYAGRSVCIVVTRPDGTEVERCVKTSKKSP
jgi:hypothetical protein